LGVFGSNFAVDFECGKCGGYIGSRFWEVVLGGKFETDLELI
jgi:hypothetical protein